MLLFSHDWHNSHSLDVGLWKVQVLLAILIHGGLFGIFKRHASGTLPTMHSASAGCLVQPTGTCCYSQVKDFTEAQTMLVYQLGYSKMCAGGLRLEWPLV